MSTHYFRKSRFSDKQFISLSIHGQTLEFLTYSSLFSGRRVDLGTRLLLEYIRIPEKGVVLDVGCGYGVIGITIAKLNSNLKVYMVDVNPLAVKVSRYNAKLNNVIDRVTILEGDCYKPVENILFQAIYSNPPLSAGRDIVENIVLNAKKYLDTNGFAQFVIAQGREYIVNKAKQEYRIVESINKKGYTILYLKP